MSSVLSSSVGGGIVVSCTQSSTRESRCSRYKYLNKYLLLTMHRQAKSNRLSSTTTTSSLWTHSTLRPPGKVCLARSLSLYTLNLHTQYYYYPSYYQYESLVQCKKTRIHCGTKDQVSRGNNELPVAVAPISFIVPLTVRLCAFRWQGVGNLNGRRVNR